MCEAEIEQFGRIKEQWLRQYLELAGGIPSYDTVSRVFRRLDAEAFQSRFIRWVERVFHIGRGQVVAVDGKAARGSRDSFLGQRAIHFVSAFAHENGLLLGQRRVDDKSNEIKAASELLKPLFIKGGIVTVAPLPTGNGTGHYRGRCGLCI